MDNFLRKHAEAREALKSCKTPVAAFTKAFDMAANSPKDSAAAREALLDVCVQNGWMSDKHAEKLTPPTIPSPEVVALEIEQAATEWQESHEKSWGKDSGKYDAPMVKVGKEDASDLRHIASLVKSGKLSDAAKAGRHLDTIVRDELPEGFFALLKHNNIQW